MPSGTGAHLAWRVPGVGIQSGTLGRRAIIENFDDLARDAKRRDDGAAPPTEAKWGEMRASAITVRFVAVLLLYMAAVVGYFVYDHLL